jgi:hypothetical protein
MTKTESMQNIWKQYQGEHGYEPSGTRPVVDWAVKEGLLELPEVDRHDILANQMAKALREETAVDEHGRTHRVNHAVRITKHGVQGTFWGIMGYVRDDHMEKSFTQRREQIIGDCLHLRNDVDAYNDKRPSHLPYQLELNFTDDIEERLVLVKVA